MVDLRKGIRLKKRDLALFLLVVIFVPSPYLQTISIIGRLYNYLRLLSAPFIALMWFMRKGKMSRTWVLIAFLIYGWLTLVTQINHDGFSQVYTCIIYLIESKAFIMLIDMYSAKDLDRTIHVIRVALEVLFWINFISVLYKPGGLYLAIETNENYGYFLGMRNNTIEVILPFLALLLFETYMQRKSKIHVIVCCGAALLTYVISSSANSLLCVVVILVYAIFALNNKTYKYLKVPIYVAVSGIFTIILAVLGLQRYFEFFIVQVLGKSGTLTNRVRVWERSIYYIIKKPIIGYGVEATTLKKMKIFATNSCHNYFLDFLYYGGIVMLVLVAILLFISVRRLYRNNAEKVAEVIGIGLASYSILWIATPIHRGTLCYMLVFLLLVYKCNYKTAPNYSTIKLKRR